MDQFPRLGKRELICLLLFTCNYVVSVWRGFLFLWVLGMGYVILLWHSLSLPYNYFSICAVCPVSEIWASRKSFEHTDKLGKNLSSLEFKPSDKELLDKKDSCSKELSFVNSIYWHKESVFSLIYVFTVYCSIIVFCNRCLNETVIGNL